MYESFASVYDEFMQTIPAGQWADYAERLFETFLPEKPELVLDLACGTGSLCLEMDQRGYNMIGVDASTDMLLEAQRKAQEKGRQNEILFLNQDMRSFELYGTVGAILCTCDSLNYLLEEEDLLQVFRLAENYLDPGGVFLFDMNTQYLYEKVLADNVFADTAEDAAFIWENDYDPEKRMNEYAVTFFKKEGKLYRRSEEVHLERAYPVKTVTDLLTEAHLQVEGVFDAFSLDEPKMESERIVFVAREKRKEKKHE